MLCARLNADRSGESSGRVAIGTGTRLRMASSRGFTIAMLVKFMSRAARAAGPTPPRAFSWLMAASAAA